MVQQATQVKWAIMRNARVKVLEATVNQLPLTCQIILLIFNGYLQAERLLLALQAYSQLGCILVQSCLHSLKENYTKTKLEALHVYILLN